MKDDVLIVGAGLAGLAAALELQSAGRRVRVLEARDRAGGLCSTEEWEGLEYSIACNDFAGGLVRRCQAMGIEQRFREVTSRFVIGPDGGMRDYHLPPRIRSAGPWLRRSHELARLALAIRREARAGRVTATLGDLLDRVKASPRLRSLCGILGYAYGMPASEVAIDGLLAELSPRYGYDTARSFVPEGGPQHLADALVDRVRALGGRVELETKVDQIIPEVAGYCVVSDAGCLHARAVVSSLVPRDERPPASRRAGLAPTSIRLRLGPEARLPRDLHTLARFPAPTESFIPALWRGEFPDDFGFHFFPCETPARDGARAANVLFFSPVGSRELTADRRRQLVDTCLAGLDGLLPGLAEAVEAWDLVEPARIEQRTGLSLSVIPHIRRPGESKLPILEPSSRIARVGTRYGPPGDHAGAAWLSGVWAARAVLDA